MDEVLLKASTYKLERHYFRDKIGEMPVDLQAKLPRALHEKYNEAIGAKNVNEIRDGAIRPNSTGILSV